MSDLATAAGPIMGSMTRRLPCSSASITSSTWGAPGGLALAGPAAASAWRAACSPVNLTRIMLSWVACAGVLACPALLPSGVPAAVTTWPDRSDPMAATLATAGPAGAAAARTSWGSDPLTHTASAEEPGREMLADTLALVLGDPGKGVVAEQAAADRAEHRPDPQSLHPPSHKPEQSPGQAGGQRAREGLPRVMQVKPALGIDRHDDLIEDGVAVPADAFADRAAGLRCAPVPGEARQQDAQAHIGGRAGHPVWCSIPGWGSGSSS